MSEKNIKIEEIVKVDDELLAAMNRLVPQLSNSNSPPDRSALEGIVVDNIKVVVNDDI